MPGWPAENGPIVLIGPMKAGKSTVGKLLAERLDLPFVSLDDVERKYAQEAGRDPQVERDIWTERGVAAWYAYRREFFDEAVVRFLAEHSRGVLELGGGHAILPDERRQARVNEVLARCATVVLLLPKPDLQESLAILKTRQGPDRRDIDFNEMFLEDRRYFQMAKFVIHTDGLSPEETCARILAIGKQDTAGSTSG